MNVMAVSLLGLVLISYGAWRYFDTMNLRVAGSWMLVGLIAAAAPVLTMGTARATTFPDARLTPGAVVPGVTAAQVCTPGYASSVRPRGRAWYDLKNTAFDRYGVPPHHHYGYVGDHLIPLELGGDPTSVQNIWPEPYAEAHEKDYFEDALRIEVCDGRISLQQAQQRIFEWPHALEATPLTAAEVRALQRMTESADY